MTRSIIAKLLAIAAICGIGYLVIINLPKTTVESYRESEFVLNMPFKDLQKSMRRGNFEQETLRINKAIVLDKKWIDQKFHIERPLHKNRYWEFRGQMNAKVQVDSPKAGRITVDLIEQIEFCTDRIDIHTILMKPLDIGLTDMRQSISINPHGENHCKVKLTAYLKLQRLIPKKWRDYAQQEMDSAADESIVKMTSALQKMR